MIAPDTFRLNAYRVLRLPASASAADIEKAAARTREAAGVRVSRIAEIDLPQLGDVPRGEADIRAAIDRLANPVARITDRLFWFCQLPTPSSAQHSSSDMDPTGHDTILRDLINVSATHVGLDEAGLAAWVRALRSWYAVTCDDDYWFLTLIYEDYGGLEAPATSEEVEALRANAVRLAAEPLLLAVRAAVEANEKETVRRVIRALSELTDTGPWASAVIDEIEEFATPEMERFGTARAG